MLINYFLVLVTLLLFAGLVLDAGMLQLNRTIMQTAADAAAQEAVYQLARNDSNWLTEAQAQATSNGYTNGVNSASVSIVNPPTSGTYAGNNLVVQATISQPVRNIFMALLNNASTTVATSATAQIIPTCIWIMNPSSTSSGSLQLASAGMYANCGVYEGTNTGYTLGVDYFSTLASARIRVYNTASSASGSSGTISVKPKYNAAKKRDPLAYLTSPTLTSCTYNNVSYSSATATLSPGTYCGGLSFTSSTITLNPGLYIIAGGLTSNNSNIYGTGGVTLYFTKTSSSSSYSTVSIKSNNNNAYGIYLKAPTTSSGGAIPAVVMFADRNWVTHGSQGLQLDTITVQTDGFWYLPNTGLYMWSVPFNYYAYNGLVIDNLYQFGSSSNFASNYAVFNYVSPLHYDDGVLVQ